MTQDATHAALNKLSITKDNRHQYYETAIVSASSADSQIRRAEERGRQRVVREQHRIRQLKQASLVLLALVVCAVLATVLLR